MTHTLVMCCVLGGGALENFSSSSCRGFVLAGPQRMSVSIFFFTGGDFIYLFIFSLVPPEESVLYAPEWEAVNGI